MVNVLVKGTIVSNDDKWIYDWLEYEATCPKDISKALEDAKGDEVTLQVNSGGGDVFAGNEIYYLINQYEGKIRADITGIAASIATVICCGANSVRIVPGGQYMVHNVSSSASGDYNAMDKASEILKNANKTISNTYRLKTGMSEADLLELMNRETWLDAVKAKEYGFVDEIIGGEKLANKGPQNIYNAAFVNIVNEETKEKIRNMVKNPDINQNDEMDFLINKEKLNLLRMRGI